MRVRVIINPAAGQAEPVLAELNRAFAERSITWDAAVTSARRDAAALAREAVREGVELVAAYGGDGTISSAAAGLVGGEVPLAILPGGTNNVIAQALEIPLALADAAALVGGDQAEATWIDTLRVGDRHALIRVGVGADAKMIERSTRARKDRLGWLAYLIAALEQAAVAEPVPFTVTLDDRVIEREALSCIVTNIGRIGRGGLRLPGPISPFDGALDVLLIRRASLEAARTLCAGLLAGDAPSPEPQDDAAIVYHRGTRVRVDATPPQPAQVDGESLGTTPLEVTVAPRSLRVVTPRATQPALAEA